jgi:hypothetical protein
MATYTERLIDSYLNAFSVLLPSLLEHYNPSNAVYEYKLVGIWLISLKRLFYSRYIQQKVRRSEGTCKARFDPNVYRPRGGFRCNLRLAQKSKKPQKRYLGRLSGLCTFSVVYILRYNCLSVANISGIQYALFSAPSMFLESSGCRLLHFFASIG